MASTSQMDSSLLKKKINKILDSQLEHDKETLEALKGLSSLVTDNNLNTRRNLRSKIEKQSLLVNEEFLKSFLEVKNSLDSLYDDVQVINGTCQEMMNQIQSSRSQTSHLLNQTNQLRTENQVIQVKQVLADGFLHSFQLKPEEIMILRGSGNTSATDDIDERFFGVLNRVKKIHEDSKMLLMSNQQTTGIEVMDAMALHQEAAFERLFRWTLSVLRSISSDVVEVHPQIYHAMNCLQQRDMLFKYSMDEFITVRRAAVVRNFIDALTRGDPQGKQMPIEKHSFDSIRYVGDMLAWLFQAIASEKEMLDNLLKLCNKEVLLQNKVIVNALSSISEGLSRPLKVRVEQTLIGSDQSGINRKMTPAIHYRIRNMIKFYHHTLSQTLPTESPLLYTLNELFLLSHRMFINSLNFHCVNKIGRTDSSEVELPPVDLGPTESLNQVLSMLQDVLSCQDACSVSIEDRKQEVPQIVATVVEPLIKSCIISASKLTAIEMAVFLSNCLHEIYSVLSKHEFTDQYKQTLQTQMDGYLESLISEQTSHMIAFLGMSSLYNAVSMQSEEGNQRPKLSTLSGCDSLALQTCMKNMDSFLASPNSLLLPLINSLRNTNAKNVFWQRSLEMVCSIYKQIYDAVHDVANGYEDPSVIMHHNPDKVRILLL